MTSYILSLSMSKTADFVIFYTVQRRQKTENWVDQAFKTGFKSKKLE